jgi:hypothetical protein
LNSSLDSINKGELLGAKAIQPASKKRDFYRDYFSAVVNSLIILCFLLFVIDFEFGMMLET